MAIRADIARQPRTIVQVNGVTMGTAVYDWQVDNNTHYQADTFRASVAASALPVGYGADWWCSQAKLLVEIFAGFPSDPANYSTSDLDSIFYGRVEPFEYEPATGLISISGRDLTALLIDAKTSEKYANLTASQIATKLATSHGLTPVVTATKTRVGRYYTQDLVRIQNERTEWELITWLAREENFDVFVRGKSLYFQPKADGSSPFAFVYSPPSPAVPQFNGTKLTFSRDFGLAKDIVVNVRSWDPKRGQGFTKTAKATHTKSKVLKGASAATYDVQTYTYTIANLNPDQAQARANQIALELSAHEMKCAIEGPARNGLSVTDVISVTGTGTVFDQTYYPDSIIRAMSVEEGYHWTINAKNHPAESEPAL